MTVPCCVGTVHGKALQVTGPRPVTLDTGGGGNPVSLARMPGAPMTSAVSCAVEYESVFAVGASSAVRVSSWDAADPMPLAAPSVTP